MAQRFQNGDVQRYIIAVMVGTAGILFGSTYYLAYQGIHGQELKIDKRTVTLKLGDVRMRPGQLRSTRSTGTAMASSTKPMSGFTTASLSTIIQIPAPTTSASRRRTHSGASPAATRFR
jgi:hypothetical protein